MRGVHGLLGLILVAFHSSASEHQLKLVRQHELGDKNLWRCPLSSSTQNTPASFGFDAPIDFTVTMRTGTVPVMGIDGRQSIPGCVFQYVTDFDIQGAQQQIEAGLINSAKNAAAKLLAAPAQPRAAADLLPRFGNFTQQLREAVALGGSEFGTGLTLFSLVVATQARDVLEVGRFRGFSTFALASGLRLLDIGWQEPSDHTQRIDINYTSLHGSGRGKLVSLDPSPRAEAQDRIVENGLSDYVELLAVKSHDYTPARVFDLMFIDGDHSYDGLMGDCKKLLPYLKPGGYFAIHDYFGWYSKQGRNGSPIRKVAHELTRSWQYEQLLIDTKFMSFVVFRKPYATPSMVENNLPKPTNDRCGLNKLDDKSEQLLALERKVAEQQQTIRDLQLKLKQRELEPQLTLRSG